MNLLTNFLIFAAVAAACCGQMTCPSGWTLSEEVCYMVDAEVTLDWAGANVRCQTLGGPSARLASVYNDIQNSMILDLKSTAPGDATDIWLGLEACQEAASGGWYWFDKEPYGYSNWYPDQTTGVFTCGAADIALGSQWVETDCSEQHGIACKSPKDGDSCPAGFQEHENNCYFINPSLSLDHDSAVQYCTSHAETSHLTSIVSSAEATYIDEVARELDISNSQIYWIGLERNELDEQWNWLSGANKSVEFWHDTQPENSDSTRLCSYMGTTTEFSGEWYSSQCDGVKPYVCRMSVADGCDSSDGWVVMNGSSCFYFEKDNIVDQSTAYQNCKILHPTASLAWIETQQENDFILQQFPAGGSAIDPWLGYYRCNNTLPETSWIWLDAGSPVGPDGYFNFNGDRASDSGGHRGLGDGESPAISRGTGAVNGRHNWAAHMGYRMVYPRPVVARPKRKGDAKKVANSQDRVSEQDQWIFNKASVSGILDIDFGDKPDEISVRGNKAFNGRSRRATHTGDKAVNPRRKAPETRGRSAAHPRDLARDGSEVCAHMAIDGHWIGSACDFQYGMACQVPAVMSSTTNMQTTTDGDGGGGVTTSLGQATTTASGAASLVKQFFSLLISTAPVILFLI